MVESHAPDRDHGSAGQARLTRVFLGYQPPALVPYGHSHAALN